jgi:hypothetical protein
LATDQSIAAVIRRRLDGDPAVVERDVFGTEDPQEIGVLVDGFCRTQLGSGAAFALFYRSSIGCVLGLQLHDGAHVVLKAHQPDKSAARLVGCQAVQSGLHARGFPCPEPLLPPTALGRGLAVVERHLERGARADAHDPAIRDELAARLHELVALARVARLGTELGGSWYGALPADRVWPQPHNARHDLAATARGAEWIDELAHRARAVPLAGERVLAHFDWKVEHCRFEAGTVQSVYDWDSLHFEREPIAVGTAASGFTADWDREDVFPAPTLGEIHAFLASYERARGRSFEAAERRTAHAACVYALAYHARWQHASGRTDARSRAFIDLLREAGPALLPPSE